MTLKKYLSSLSHETLSKKFKGCIPGNGLYSTSEVVDNIISDFFSPEALFSRYNELSLKHKEILSYLMCFDNNKCSLDFLHAHFPAVSISRVKSIVEELQDVFFVIKTDDGDLSYFKVFPCVIDALRQKVIDERIESWLKVTNKSVKNSSSHFMPIWNDIITLLILCSKGELFLTKSGNISKKCIGKVISNFQLNEDIKSSMERSYYLIDPKVDRFSIIYYYVHEEGLIHIKKDKLEITEDGIGWIKQPLRNKIDNFLNFVSTRLANLENNLDVTFELIGSLNKWAHAKWLVNVHDEFDINKKLVLTKRNIRGFDDFPFFYKALCYAGIVELAWDIKKNNPMIKLTSLGEQYFSEIDVVQSNVQTLFFTPSYDVFIPPETDFWKRFILSCLFECVKFDQVYKLHIERSSVNRALQVCFSNEEAENIIDITEKECDIPANVIHSVRSWIKSFGQISFFNPFILSIKDKELADELKRIPDLRIYLKQEIPNFGFVIDKADYESVLKVISENGYYPRLFKEEQER